MRTITCAIVDNDQFSSGILVNLIEKFGNLEIVGNFGNPQEALMRFESTMPEILFLDMDLAGKFDLSTISHAEKSPLIIAISDKRNHIHEAELGGAFDFLKKPVVDFDRFERGMQKAMIHLGV